MPAADDKNRSYDFCETMDRWTATAAVAVRAAWPTTSWIGMVVAQDCTCPWHMPSFRVGVCCMRLAHLSCCRRSCQLHVHILLRIAAIDATSFFNWWYSLATWCAAISLQVWIREPFFRCPTTSRLRAQICRWKEMWCTLARPDPRCHPMINTREIILRLLMWTRHSWLGFP